jgi:hypothetical protein
LFAEKATQTIVDAMDAERATIRTRVLENMGAPIDTYRLSDGVRDVQRYHEAGSLVVGLTRLSNAAAAAKKVAEEGAEQQRQEMLSVR